MIQENEPVALAGPVVTEVLQGLKRDAAPIELLLATFDLLEPSGFETYCRSAAIFRTARGRGISLTTIDTLIAAIAAEQDASVFTLDRDFVRMAPIAGFSLYEF